MRPHRLIALLLLIVVAACEPLPIRDDVPLDWAARDAAVLALGDWQVRGRVAVKSAQGGGNGDLRWHQEGAAAHIRLSGPFGARALEIHWGPAGVWLLGRDGGILGAWDDEAAAEAFLDEELGWPFPATSVRWWLLALADPALPAEHFFAASGELAGLVQGGWDISYERYMEADGLVMPRRLTIEGAQARLRVVVDHWCLTADCLPGLPSG